MQTSSIKIGTRGSPLALKQAEETRDKLIAAHDLDPDMLEIVVITTTGDRVRDRPLSEIGGKGLFTREIETALFENSIDLAVHSMKDVAARQPDGLEFVCILEREDPRDAFLSPVANSIRELPQGAVVGSSSVRRAAQVKNLRPDLQVVQFRGNVETRLQKLSDGVADATFLACAGLNRLGKADLITSEVGIDEMLPAVAQGAIGIEIRSRDDRLRELLQPLNHEESATTVAAERGFLSELDGSCRTPLAGHAILTNGTVDFRGMALTLDGTHIFEASRSGTAADAALLGVDAAREVSARAGDRLFN